LLQANENFNRGDLDQINDLVFPESHTESNDYPVAA